jgi:hypothetical protein
MDTVEYVPGLVAGGLRVGFSIRQNLDAHWLELSRSYVYKTCYISTFSGSEGGGECDVRCGGVVVWCLPIKDRPHVKWRWGGKK